MKRICYIFLVLMSVIVVASCSDTETYAERLEKERTAISKYLNDSAVTVISEAQFEKQNYTTDVRKNEFVLIASSGVYMQIMRGGCGEKIKDGETVNVLCRFRERNLMTDSVQLNNDYGVSNASFPEKMSVRNTSGTFTAAFTGGDNSLMFNAYGSTSVPSGWLTPFAYIKVGRQTTAEEEIAKVRLIVPASQGQYHATVNTYPCLYDITYERGR
ncbi:DUF4827 domain-containing protein [Prevotella sp. KH2C16]|uniref:DUF4827 domain-containing protein n=1 Tax=Prevotella sp. KH2C16 TaxID=1855325 RepID=UPI0008ECD3BE|nr:DUF4827 domain-containing protein [Prevotella sp. KH2C16]SFG20336.1 protein of unknown function [Prevotella sp. KH2C16]